MKILIATDGSDYSTAAIEECCRVVIRPETADVLIVSAYEDAYPIAAEPFAVSAEYYQKLDDAVIEMAKGFVESAEKMVRDKFPDADFPVTTKVLRGAPDQQIIETAKEWKADVIVVGSHGRGFWGRLLGSVSNGVVHHAECSVLVVRKPTP
ncbi:MAG TPA: universal stress protein [Pyrinomonadaceae bacterium]|jgi:nucleotide-binding universal stress UspA family protein|nr:universal stress protein [Pyrinomonadaceae bacterium]